MSAWLQEGQRGVTTWLRDRHRPNGPGDLGQDMVPAGVVVVPHPVSIGASRLPSVVDQRHLGSLRRVTEGDLNVGRRRDRLSRIPVEPDPPCRLPIGHPDGFHTAGLALGHPFVDAVSDRNQSADTVLHILKNFLAAGGLAAALEGVLKRTGGLWVGWSGEFEGRMGVREPIDVNGVKVVGIDVSQDDDLDYWSERFRVSREKLRSTVERIGPLVKDVEEHLHGHR